MPGTAISPVEVSQISRHGLWVLVRDQELFLSFDDFPWFRKATVDQILKVEEVRPGHLYWPELDVDLSLDSIQNPERYPLVARGTHGKD